MRISRFDHCKTRFPQKVFGIGLDLLTMLKRTRGMIGDCHTHMGGVRAMHRICTRDVVFCGVCGVCSLCAAIAHCQIMQKLGHITGNRRHSRCIGGERIISKQMTIVTIASSP